MHTIAHIYWYGPLQPNEIKKFNDKSIDYGIYQLYGRHPVYGRNALLYIGKAEQQTFYQRLKQHEIDIDEYNEGEQNIYVGRLVGIDDQTPENWNELIGLCETLLINSLTPAHNSSCINQLKYEVDIRLQNLHILNWGNYAQLPPEVSGERWSRKWDFDDEFVPFSM